MIIQKILEEQTTIELLPVSQLEVDRTYQRQPGESKIKAISSKFNEVAAGILAVSLREDGCHFVMDGQHRLEAMKRRGIESARCQVCRGLTIEQEAEIYVYCNTVRKTPSALDVFRARLVTSDLTAVAINNIVEKCGLHIQFTRGGRHSPTSIWAVGALDEIYGRNEKHLQDVLTLAMRCWPDDSKAFEAKVLLGIDRFIAKYQGQYSREEFFARMSTVSLDILRQRAHYHIATGGLHERQAFAKALQETYDKGKRLHRLENKPQ